MREGHLELPSPAGLAARLMAWLGLAALGQALWIGLGAAVAFEAAPVEAIRLGGVLLALALPTLAAGVWAVVHRTSPLYRAIVRFRSGGSVPPSPSAMRDAQRAPVWLALAGSTAAILVALIDALGSGGRSFDLFVLASGLWAAAPSAVAVRRCFEPWLSRFRPDEQMPEPRRVPASLTALEVSSPAVAVSIACAAVIAATAEGPAVAVAWLVGAVGACAAVSLGILSSRRLAGDAASLVARIGEATDQLPEARSPAIDLGAAGYRTREVAELAEELQGMVRRYERTARGEEAARESVQELQRQKMLFMASMSHDLRSPLNSILGFSELLSHGQLTEPQLESVRLIARSGEKLLRLLDDVLDCARFEAGRLQLRRDWTPSVEILTDAVQRAREIVADADVEIVAELQPGLPPVYVDRDRIVQAVVGLFRHAAGAMSAGTIRMYARVAPDPGTGVDRLRVDVVDRTGSIREEDRERMFEAFREITSTAGRRIGGLGLTLSLARALVRAHGGDVWIENRAGEGTTFTVAIPLTAG